MRKLRRTVIFAVKRGCFGRLCDDTEEGSENPRQSRTDLEKS